MAGPLRAARDYLEGLLRIPRAETADEQRALFRQGLATLAAAAQEHRPVPLEGLAPDELAQAVRAALDARLVDDLSFLARPAAAAALFELGAALPVGPEKRDLGRRVLVQLHEGDGATFVALATVMALGARHGLSGAAMRARVALALDLPPGLGVHADALALALIARRELEREWLTGPSMGSLPSRRLAARLIERAAREAARRAGAGDDGGLRILSLPAVEAAWHRLLIDRDSLVWRHAAAARGLIAEVDEHSAKRIDDDLGPQAGPSRWRRGAAALAASVAVRPERALAACRALLEGPIVARDPGIATAVAFGLARAVEVEPEAAEELMVVAVRAGGTETIEALVELRREQGPGILQKATQQALFELEAAPKTPDDGLTALVTSLKAELIDRSDAASVRLELSAALDAYALGGRAQAAAATQRALDAAEEVLTGLESADESTPDGRRATFTALRELDVGVLETSRLAELVGIAGDDDEGADRLAAIHARLHVWLQSREAERVGPGPVPHLTLRLRRLKTLLHLIDADTVGEGDDAGQLRERRHAVVRLLARRARVDAPSPLRRAVCASLARALDAMIREGSSGVSEALVAVATSASQPGDLEIFAEAVAVVEVQRVFAAYAQLAKPGVGGSREAQLRARLDALAGLVRAFPVASAAHSEAMRQALLRLVPALEAVVEAGSLQTLVDEKLLRQVEVTLAGLAELIEGAARRLGLPTPGARGVREALAGLATFAERAAHGAPVEPPIFIGPIHEGLPPVLADLVAEMLGGIPLLPHVGPKRPLPGLSAAPVVEDTIAPWLPPSRTIGGFYVLKRLGHGSGGSVFVACRGEERHLPDPERVALKVPEYDGAAAHTLSEDEFLRLFREEAGALLSLPAHPNLARFITFDVGARPKPALVMELVEGPSVERLLEEGALDVESALAILRGVASGLDAMHAAGVGHLDVKPSNIILRGGDATQPVLVDFGLAGRNVRPGNDIPHTSGAPKWALAQPGLTPRPAPVDVYAYACLAFELFAGTPLMEGDTALAVVTAHLAHDGSPPRLRTLSQQPAFASLAMLLGGALRKDPRNRTTIVELGRGLDELAPRLVGHRWPLLGRAVTADIEADDVLIEMETAEVEAQP